MKLKKHWKTFEENQKAFAITFLSLGIILTLMPQLFGDHILTRILSTVGLFLTTTIFLNYVYRIAFQKAERKLIYSQLEEIFKKKYFLEKKEKFFEIESPLQNNKVDEGGKNKRIELYYLDNERTLTEKVVILLHGLGLDHYDFKNFVDVCECRCIAVTLYGFHKKNFPASPLSLEEHCKLLKIFFDKFVSRQLCPKEVEIVGFSVGADLALKFISDLEKSEVKSFGIERVVALDCNLNKKSLFFSESLSKLKLSDLSDKLEKFKELIDDAYKKNDGSWGLDHYVNIIEYFTKVFGKFSGDNWRIPIEFAREITERYSGATEKSFDEIINLLGNCCDKVKISCIFSSDTPENDVLELKELINSNGISDIQPDRKVDGHFQLISVDNLKKYLRTI